MPGSEAQGMQEDVNKTIDFDKIPQHEKRFL
jgi:hypothetical protein